MFYGSDEKDNQKDFDDIELRKTRLSTRFDSCAPLKKGKEASSEDGPNTMRGTGRGLIELQVRKG
jgi:hypothetical protein